MRLSPGWKEQRSGYPGMIRRPIGLCQTQRFVTHKNCKDWAYDREGQESKVVTDDDKVDAFVEDRRCIREIGKLATGETLRIAELEDVSVPDILVVCSYELLIWRDDKKRSRQHRDGVLRRRVKVTNKDNGESLIAQQFNQLLRLCRLNHRQSRSDSLPSYVQMA